MEREGSGVRERQTERQRQTDRQAEREETDRGRGGERIVSLVLSKCSDRDRQKGKRRIEGEVERERESCIPGVI